MDFLLLQLRLTVRILSFVSASIIFAILAAMTLQAQVTDRAVLEGTVVDATGALVQAAEVHLSSTAAPNGFEREQQTNPAGRFSFEVPPGTYALQIEAPGFAVYHSGDLVLKPRGTLRLPVQLAIARLQQEMDVADESEAGAQDGLGAGLIFEGDTLRLLSDDPSTLKQQLMALAGGTGASFAVDGFLASRIPPKSSIRSIRLSSNSFSARYAELTLSRVEISTKPGTDKLHGSINLSGTNQPLDARDPYIALPLPFYDFQQDANLNGPINKKTSFFVSNAFESLANNAAVNAANPQVPTSTVSEGLPAPQQTKTFAGRIDRQFSPRNFAYVRDEWSRTHIANSGIVPLVLPVAAFTADTLTNTLQLSDTQSLGAHAVNETRFQYLRTRVRQDPNSTLPSVVVQSAFQDGGSPAQVLRDNLDEYEMQELFDLDRGKHSLRAGFRFHAQRDANESTAGFNGQYIFPDVASYLARQPSQFSLTTGQPAAVLFNTDLSAYAEDDWKVTPNLLLSYGLRFESESAIPDHSDPAPRIGFAYAVHHGKSKEPLLTLRGGVGLFYDRFPVAQLLTAIRQDGIRETAYIAQNTGFNPTGPPAGIALTAAEPTIYRVSPALRSSYVQVAAFSVLRSLGRFGTVSGNLQYMHNTHNFLTRNINAPLPGTYDPANPGSGLRPLGNAQNVYQFSSDANGNLERFYLKYQVHPTARLFAFGVWTVDKNYNETDGIDRFPANQYDLRQDYGRVAADQRMAYTGGFQYLLPWGVQATPFLAVRSGEPFNITTGTDLNGDTIFNDRPAGATDLSRTSVVQTVFGAFDTVPAGGQATLPRNVATAPPFVWLQLRLARDFHLGPRPRPVAAAVEARPSPPAERPWDLGFTVEVQNLTNHNNPGVPVGVLGAVPCGVTAGVACACPSTSGTCALAPSPYFGHSLSQAAFFSPNTASNRTILLQTSFSW